MAPEARSWRFSAAVLRHVVDGADRRPLRTRRAGECRRCRAVGLPTIAVAATTSAISQALVERAAESRADDGVGAETGKRGIHGRRGALRGRLHWPPAERRFRPVGRSAPNRPPVPPAGHRPRAPGCPEIPCGSEATIRSLMWLRRYRRNHSTARASATSAGPGLKAQFAARLFVRDPHLLLRHADPVRAARAAACR